MWVFFGDVGQLKRPITQKQIDPLNAPPQFINIPNKL
jgi:hypothetical protein